jgi:hypothetical protein
MDATLTGRNQTAADVSFSVETGVPMENSMK